MKRTRPYLPWLLEQLRDPGNAAAYLAAAMMEDAEMFCVALQHVLEAINTKGQK